VKTGLRLSFFRFVPIAPLSAAHAGFSTSGLQAAGKFAMENEPDLCVNHQNDWLNHQNDAVELQK
jgi:hypothetical protein